MLDLFEIEVVLISKTHCIQKVEHSVWMEYLIRVKYTINDLPISVTTHGGWHVVLFLPVSLCFLW